MPRKRKEQTDNTNFQKAFPTAMRELMEKKGATQQVLADYLGKTRQAISYYCDGSSSPDWETIVKIADFFDVSTDYILGRTNDPNLQPCAMDELGLSERALEWFKSLKRGSSSRDNMAGDMCAIVEECYFQLLMYNLREYGKAITAEAIYDKGWEHYFPQDRVMYQDEARKKYEELKTAINEIIHSEKCDGYVSRYLEIVSFLNTDGTDGPGVTKLTDLLIGVEGFVASDLCAQRVHKYLTLLMEELKANARNDEIVHFFEKIEAQSMQ